MIFSASYWVYDKPLTAFMCKHYKNNTANGNTVNNTTDIAMAKVMGTYAIAIPDMKVNVIFCFCPYIRKYYFYRGL